MWGVPIWVDPWKETSFQPRSSELHGGTVVWTENVAARGRVRRWRGRERRERREPGAHTMSTMCGFPAWTVTVALTRRPRAKANAAMLLVSR